MNRRQVVILLIGAAFTSLFLFRPIRDVDMFWQIRTGELMREQGSLIANDPFGLDPAKPVPTIYWLSQLLYSYLLDQTSWAFLHHADTVLFVSAFLFVAWHCSLATIPTAAALAVCLLAAQPFHGLRPQTFGLLGFAWLVASQQSGRRSIPLRIFLGVALWQNLHPSALSGVVYLGALFVSDLLGCLGTRNFRTLRPTVLNLAAAVLGMLATPDHVHILNIMARNEAIATSIGIEEWLSVFHAATHPACRPTLVLLIVMALLQAKVGKEAKREEILLFLLFGLLSLLYFRTALLASAVLLPVMARWMAIVYPAAQLSERMTLRVALPLVVLAMLAPAIVVSAARPKTFVDSIPFEGMLLLHNHQVKGVVYNYREWGGPLVASCPTVRVVIDGRLYLYPPEAWEEYVRAALGEIPVDVLETKYHPESFFLHPGYHEGLIPLLEASPRWEKVHADANCVIFFPRSRRVENQE